MPARLVVLTFAGLFLVSPLQAQPTLYQTTLELETPVVGELAIDSVVYRWSTLATAGNLGEEHLIDLTMVLRSAGTTVYQDRAILDGVVQPFGGQVRFLDSDVFWDFELDSLTLYQMRNVSYETAEMSSGVQFYVADGVDLITDQIVDVARYVGGTSETLSVGTLDSQSTVPMLFFDGFESGDLGEWSASQP